MSFRHLTGKVSSLIVFFLLRRFHREQDYSCVKNIDGALISSKSQRPAKAGLSVFPEILAELLLVRDISSNIHVEIADVIKVNMLFHRSLLSTREYASCLHNFLDFSQLLSCLDEAM